MKKQVWKMMSLKEKILALFSEKRYLEFEKKYGWAEK